MTQTISIRGTDYPVLPVSEVTLIPLLSVLEAGSTSDLTQALQGDKAQYAQTVVQRLAEPSFHHRIAYTIKAMVPTIDPALVDYKLILNTDGTREEKCTLTLNTTTELVPLIGIALEQVNQSRSESQPPQPAPAAATPRGFGDLVRQPPATPRRQVLQPEHFPPAAAVRLDQGAEETPEATPPQIAQPSMEGRPTIPTQQPFEGAPLQLDPNVQATLDVLPPATRAQVMQQLEAARQQGQQPVSQ